MVYTCPYPNCGRIFSRKQNLNLHMMTHNKQEKQIFQQTQQQAPIQMGQDMNTRVNMLEDAIEHLTTGSGFVGKQYYNPYFQQQAPVQNEDSFDKLLKQYMQIMMIKQLSQATNSNTLTDLLKFQNFMDNRETDDEPDDPLTQMLLKQLLPSFDLGNKKKVNQGTSEMKNLPTEEDLLKMTDSEIVKLLIPYRNQMKQLQLTPQQAYQNILNFYPNFPEQRFNNIWGLLNE